MKHNESIEKIKAIFDLKEELQKNIELKERLVETKDSISENTFYQYLNTYNYKIDKIEKEINALEQIIEQIRSSFVNRQQMLSDRAFNLEKVINDTNILNDSKSIDKDEYKRRKNENDLNLSIIEQEIKALNNEKHEFESFILHETQHRQANSSKAKAKAKPKATKHQNSVGVGGISSSVNSRGTNSNNISNKSGLLDVIKNNKNISIALGSICMLIIVAVVIIFARSGYFGGNADRLSSSYQKRYPIRVPVVNNGFLYGFTDESGVIVIEAEYDDVRNFSEGYAAVKKGGKWGYIDVYGDMVIEPQYTLSYTAFFQDSLVRVSEAGKYGFIDDKNNIVIPLEYAFAREFNQGLAPVKMGDKWGYIDSNNNVVVDFIYENAYAFRDDGLAVVRLDGAEGFINTSGEYLLEPTYDSVKAYNDGLAAIRKNGLWGYINTEGSFVIENKYKNAYNFEDGFAVVQNADNTFTVVDKAGESKLNIKNFKTVANLGSAMFSATDSSNLWQLFNVSGDVKIDNGMTIAPINMYGNGAIFRVKTPYGYSLYNYAFSLVMNYYFPYTGVYKHEAVDEKTMLQSEYYFFIWYKEETRQYYAFCIYTDGHVEEPFFGYTAISMKGGKFSLQRQTVSTNVDYSLNTDNYNFSFDGDFYHSSSSYTETVVTNMIEYNIAIDKDILAVDDMYFDRIYTFENTNSYYDLYAEQINRYINDN